MRSIASVQLSVQASGRKRPVASAKPATTPVGSAVGVVETAKAVPEVPEAHDGNARARRPAPRAAPMLSPVPHATRAPGREAEQGGRLGRHRAGEVARAEHAGQRRAIELDQLEHARRRRRRCSATTSRCPRRRRGRVTPVAAEPLGHVVVGEAHAGDAMLRSRARRRRSHIHDVAVNDATGTLPSARPRPLGPAEQLDEPRSASGAERVSFQSVAGRRGRPVRAEHDEAVLLARDRDRGDLAGAARRGERRRRARAHQTSGSVSRAPPSPRHGCAAPDPGRRCFRSRDRRARLWSTASSSRRRLRGRARTRSLAQDDAKPQGEPE